MIKLTKAHGNWVDGTRFFNRNEELNALISIIKEGGHRSLTAQRRMGKTSLAREICRQLQESGDYYCFFIDIENAGLPEDVIKEMVVETKAIKSLWHKSMELFKNTFGQLFDRIEEISAMEIGIKIRAGLDAGNWQDKGDAFFNLLATQDKPVLLVIDELSIFINRILKNDRYRITPQSRELTDIFLSWLRKNAQAHKESVRIIISGSIGLDPILRQAGLNAATNVFPGHELRPWDLDTTRGCLTALANHYQIVLGPGVCEAVYEKLGTGIPHYVQTFFDALHTDAQHRQKAKVLVEDVNRVYQNSMLSVRGTSELEHYQGRLKLVLGDPLYTLALDMLTEAAVGNGLDETSLSLYREQYRDRIENTEAAIKDVLYVLEHDGYLNFYKGRYRFVLNILKDWWSARHKIFFVPVKERG